MEVEAFHLDEKVVVMGPRVILRERRFTVQLVYKDVSRSPRPKGKRIGATLVQATYRKRHISQYINNRSRLNDFPVDSSQFKPFFGFSRTSRLPNHIRRKS